MKLSSLRTYALLTGVLLFTLGFLGFAFRGNFKAPDSYFLGALVLGFWGIVTGLANRQT